LKLLTQNWNVNSISDLHIHNERGREKTKYNSLIYLNDNYNGGEFYTKNGIVIKPSVGLLTLFNGQKVWHGVNMVKKKDRHTLIFWWKNNG
jgi:predicted 2-oxoglutarate/Fe(II)-dependent dioxygenase YbiX